MENKLAEQATKKLIDTIIAAGGVTRYRIAKTTGINQAALQRYTNGDATPSLAALIRLAQAYGHYPAVAQWFTDTFNLPDR